MMLILQELPETKPQCSRDNISYNDIKKESLAKEEVPDTFYMMRFSRKAIRYSVVNTNCVCLLIRRQ